MPGKLVHFDIPADDVGGMVDFYGKVMGWKLERYEPAPGAPEYWLVEPVPGNEDAAGGGIGARGAPGQKPMNYYDAEGGLDAFNQRVRDSGGTVTVERMAVPKFGWLSECLDPEGNVFGGWEADPNAA